MRREQQEVEQLQNAFSAQMKSRRSTLINPTRLGKFLEVGSLALQRWPTIFCYLQNNEASKSVQPSLLSCEGEEYFSCEYVDCYNFLCSWKQVDICFLELILKLWSSSSLPLPQRFFLSSLQLARTRGSELFGIYLTALASQKVAPSLESIILRARDSRMKRKLSSPDRLFT